MALEAVVDAGTGAEVHSLSTLCPRQGALGGCAIDLGTGVATAWYYDNGPWTADDVHALCASAQATFVAP